MQNPLNSVAAAVAAAATLNDSGSYALNTLQQNLKNRKRLEHTPSSRTVSSEESWGSERGGTNSEHEFSSDGEDDDKKSINSLTSVNTRNSHLRSTLNKAKQHLSFDKWRAANAAQTPTTPTNVMPSQQPENLSPGEAPAGRLARWFSIRRGSTHQYDFGSKNATNGRDSRANSVELDDKPHKAAQTLNGAVINGYKMPLLPEVSGRYFRFSYFYSSADEILFTRESLFRFIFHFDHYLPNTDRGNRWINNKWTHK